MNQSNLSPIPVKPHSKLIDYTQQRRDDMPSRAMIVRSPDSSPCLSSQIHSHLRRRSSSTTSHSSRSGIITNNDLTSAEDDDNAPIEFLFKKTFRRHKRSSDLSREELLHECEKRYYLQQQEKQQQGQCGDDSAISSQDNVFLQNPRRRSSYESNGSLQRRDSKRLGHIDRLLRSEITSKTSATATPESKTTVRALRHSFSELGTNLGGENFEKKPVPSQLLERRKSGGPTVLSTEGAKAA